MSPDVLGVERGSASRRDRRGDVFDAAFVMRSDKAELDSASIET